MGMYTTFIAPSRMAFVDSRRIEMQFGMSIKVPIERGEQLRAFASTLDVPIGEALGLLLDHGARTGLGNTLALRGIEITCNAGLVQVEIGGVAMRPQSAAQAQSFAGSIRGVATTG